MNYKLFKKDFDIPQMANRVVDLSVDTPIDVPRAIELLGNQTKIFYQMLGKLEKLSLNPALTDIS